MNCVRLTRLGDKIPVMHYIQKRFKIKSKKHWALKRRKIRPTDIALSNFDEFYAPYFKKSWPSVRLGLLCSEKYCAVVNNYGDRDTTNQKLKEIGCLDLGKVFADNQHNLVKERESRKRETIINTVKKTEESEKDYSIEEGDIVSLGSFIPSTELKGMDDWKEESDYFKNVPSDDIPVTIVPDTPWTFPQHLNVKVFPRTDVSTFSSPKRDVFDVFDTYLMNGSSILPVLALDIQPGEAVLDLCAAPGGKSLALLQTLIPGSLHCNDVSASRLARLRSVLSSYIPDSFSIIDGIKLTNEDAVNWRAYSSYDKVLLDAPCTNDRISLEEDDNNWYSHSRIKERVAIPELQTSLLFSALCAVKAGGTVVYSTCSLSPAQNDGVVHMALKRVWKETDMNIEVVDMKRSVMPFYSLFWFKYFGLRYGQLVVPSLINNFGPLYFSKLRRVS